MSTEPELANNGDVTRRFVELLTSHQRDLYAYVNTLLAGDPAAADVVQDANVDLWAHLGEYDFERPFLPWAMRFAFNRVLAHRKSRGRSRLVFSDEFVQALSADCGNDSVRADVRLGALRGCLERLTQSQRQLIDERYLNSGSVKTIATRLGDTAGGVSAQLYRIRKCLAKCIEARMAGEGSPR